MKDQTSSTSFAQDDITARHIRGAALIAGAALLLVLVDAVLSFSWVPALIGATYLAAAAASRSRGTLWAPGLVLLAVGLGTVLWETDGRPVDSFQFLALAVMALGLGGVLAALLAQLRGLSVSAMSVSLAVLLFGGFSLLEQQTVDPFTGQGWPYSLLLALYGLYELRPGRRSAA